MRREAAKKLVTMIAVCLAAVFACSMPTYAASDTMKVTAIDLGGSNTGEAVMISDGKGKSLLVDSGDNNNRTIFKWLDRNGYKHKKFDTLVTHWHDDHAGNTAEIIKRYNVGTVYIPTLKYIKSEKSDYYKYEKTYADATLAAAKKRGTKVVYLKKGQTIKVGTVRGKVLYCCGSPKKENWYAVQYINNQSAVIMFTGGGSKFLTAGDIQSQAEKRLLKSGVSLKADIFKMSHHGYDRSNSGNFIKAVRPTYSYFTSSEGVTASRYKSNSVANGVTRMGRISNVMSTRYNGTIKYICKGGKITVKAQRNLKTMYQKTVSKSARKTKLMKYVFNKACTVRMTDKILNTDKYYNRQLNANGTVFTGSWKKVKGKTYLIKNGVKAFNTFAKKNGKTYWFGKDGDLLKKGFVNAYGMRFYMNPSLVTGFKIINGRRYYFMDKRCSKYKSICRGKMMAGFFTVNGKTYYGATKSMKGYKASDYGAIQTGWRTINNKLYYIRSDGVVRK